VDLLASGTKPRRQMKIAKVRGESEREPVAATDYKRMEGKENGADWRKG